MSKDWVEAARKYAVEEIKKNKAPNIAHFEISENVAIKLAKELNADLDIVKTGHALMDLKLGEAMKEGRIKEHVKMSSDATREFLNNYQIDDEVKDKIINCVEAHHREVGFSCIESEICANADSYRFLHPRGVFLFAKMLGERKSGDLDQMLDYIEEKLEEKWNNLTLDECKKELEEYYKTFKKLLVEARNSP